MPKRIAIGDVTFDSNGDPQITSADTDAEWTFSNGQLVLDIPDASNDEYDFSDVKQRNVGGLQHTVTEISADHTTAGESIIYVDTSTATGDVTVTLSTADTVLGQAIEIWDAGANASTNNIIVDTEGSQTINPGGASSKTVSTDGNVLRIKSDGSNWFADLNTQRETVDTESLVIGGTLFEEDGNSPIDVSGTSSSTYSVDGTFNHIIIIPQGDNRGQFDQLRVNGDSNGNYFWVDNNDSQTSSQTEFDLGAGIGNFANIELRASGSNVEIGAKVTTRTTGVLVGGLNNNETSPITQFTVIQSGGSNADLQARVYGRSMGI